MSHKSAKNARRLASEPQVPPWTNFVVAKLPPIDENDVRDQAKKLNMPYEVVYASYEAILREENILINSRYQVNVRVCEPEDGGQSEMTHLSIKRIDKKIIHDWRDLQRIKNEIIGPEYEAVEIYPAESRLVDTANQYHLWVFTKKGYKLPFGFNARKVVDDPGGNAVQRPFEKTV